MPKVSRAFFALGAVYVFLGMCWGMYMGKSGDHSTYPAHAHLNLIGWVTFSLYGTYYALARGSYSMRLAWIVFALSEIGFLMSIPVLGYMLFTERNPTLVMLVRIGEPMMAIGLLKDLLIARPNAIALFVPSEITTYCFYPGLQKDYMVANAIFRMGGAAIMMTNKPAARRTAKYQLTHNVRMHTGQDDGAYK